MVLNVELYSNFLILLTLKSTKKDHRHGKNILQKRRHINYHMFIRYKNHIKMNKQDYLLSIQHLFAMFGATVLVPLLTGFNPSICLITAGIGTLIFHWVTKGKVPVFLGSSFAFIPAILLINNTQMAQSGIISAGMVHIALAGLIYHKRRKTP